MAIVHEEYLKEFINGKRTTYEIGDIVFLYSEAKKGELVPVVITGVYLKEREAWYKYARFPCEKNDHYHVCDYNMIEGDMLGFNEAKEMVMAYKQETEKKFWEKLAVCEATIKKAVSNT